jgi:DNA-binding FrmR family transcriptional regulator
VIGVNLKATNIALHDDLLRRMKRIEGQTRGIQRMLEEGSDCEQVVIQVGAIKSALNRVGMKLIACHMGTRICEAMQNGTSPEVAIEDMTEQFLKLG